MPDPSLPTPTPAEPPHGSAGGPSSLRLLAHDLNNRLMVIGGNLELLRSRFGAGDPLPEEFLDIEEATAGAVTLAREILAAARRLEPRPAAGEPG